MNITLITGASGGLGLELAKLYRKDKNNLLLVGSNEERLKKAKDELLKIESDAIIDFIEADLTIDSERVKVFEYTKEKNYFVNNLVNNAGFGDRTDFKDMDIDFNLKLNHLNCDAPLYFTRVFLTDMLKNNEGHIINVGSIAGYCPGPYMATYHASKAYLLILGESIAEEIKKTNVHLLTLNPGPFKSNFVNVAGNNYTMEKFKPISAEKVARYGYKMSLKGKRVKIVGTLNKIVCFLEKIMPTRLVTYLSARQLKNPKDIE